MVYEQNAPSCDPLNHLERQGVCMYVCVHVLGGLGPTPPNPEMTIND